LTRRILDAVQETICPEEKSISIAFEEVPSENWMTEVFTPDILIKKETLYKKPGYNKELL
jgi:4-oxalocrotonate tautomerase